MRDPEAFFSEIADGLPFGEVERAEILEELRAHVADSRAELEAEGLSPDAAERVAVDRLGQPERLARALTEARRSRRRLLAAAGAGSWAVVTSGIYGWIVGTLLALVAWVGTIAMVRFVGPFAFDSVSFIATGVAVYVAGSAATPVATRAGYRAEAVRRALALAGALVLAAYALVGWSGPLDAVGVVARLTLPVWWIAGTWRGSRVRRGSLRTFGALLIVAVVATVTIQLAQMQLREVVGGARSRRSSRGRVRSRSGGRLAWPREHSWSMFQTPPGSRVGTTCGSRPGGRLVPVLRRRRRSARPRARHSSSRPRSGVLRASSPGECSSGRARLHGDHGP